MIGSEWPPLVDASSVDMATGDRTLVGPPLRSHADAGAGGVRRNVRGVGTRGRRRRAVGEGRNVGGRRRSRIGRTTLSKTNNLGTGDNESIEGVGPDIGPLESIVHSGETGEIAGRWLVSASVVYVNLNAAWVVLGYNRMKGNDLIANQVLPRG